MGRFWSGCAKMTKRDLEISGIGLIDMGFHVINRFRNNKGKC